MKTCDVVVVGGGVIGSAVTYYLAKAGLSVTMVERGDVASGTSSACDGNVLVTDKMPGLDSQLTLKGQEMYASLEDELGFDIEFRQRGSTLAVEDEEQERIALELVKIQQDAGLPMRYIQGGEIFQKEPMLARDIIGLVECACDLSLNPMAAAFGYVEAAKRLGARILTFCEAAQVLLDSQGGVIGVETTQGPVKSPRVVLSAGVWTTQLAKTAGVDLPIIPRKGTVLVSEQTFPVGARKIMEFGYLMAKFGGQARRGVEKRMEDLGIALVFEPTPHGNFLIGSSREYLGFDAICSPEVMKLLARRAMRFFPVIEGIGVIRSYSGLRPYTPDHLPIVGETRDVAGLYIAAGHEGDGIGLAPVTGLLISEILTKTPTCIPVDDLCPERFQGRGKKEEM
jgi:sarcosine oxidase subunit beta